MLARDEAGGAFALRIAGGAEAAIDGHMAVVGGGNDIGAAAGAGQGLGQAPALDGRILTPGDVEDQKGRIGDAGADAQGGIRGIYQGAAV